MKRTVSTGLQSLLLANAIAVVGCHYRETPAQPPVSTTSANVAYRDPAFDRTPAELDKQIADQTKGYRKVETILGDLGTVRPTPLSLRRGNCYQVVLKLATGARFSERARSGLHFVFRGIDGNERAVAAPGIIGPGGIAAAGCPQANANATFELENGSVTDKPEVQELGWGRYELIVYAKPIDENGLAILRGGQDRQFAEAEMFDRQEAERKSKACARCVHAYHACLRSERTPRATCDDERQDCAYREAGSIAACGK